MIGPDRRAGRSGKWGFQPQSSRASFSSAARCAIKGTFPLPEVRLPATPSNLYLWRDRMSHPPFLRPHLFANCSKKFVATSMVGPDRRAGRLPKPRINVPIPLPPLGRSSPPLLPARPNRRDFTSMIAHFAHFSSNSSPFFPASSPPLSSSPPVPLAIPSRTTGASSLALAHLRPSKFA